MRLLTLLIYLFALLSPPRTSAHRNVLDLEVIAGTSQPANVHSVFPGPKNVEGTTSRALRKQF